MKTGRHRQYVQTWCLWIRYPRRAPAWPKDVAFLGRWCLPIVFGERLVWEHQPFIRNRTQLSLPCPPQGKMCLADTATVWWMGFFSPQGRMSHLQELQLSQSPGSCGFCWAMLGGKGGFSSLNHGKCPTCKAALLGLCLQWESS